MTVLYGHQARRQIAEDEEEEKQVANMREMRLARRLEKEEIAQQKAIDKQLKAQG
jgi:hypothetical protein